MADPTIQTYECIELDSVGDCLTWQVEPTEQDAFLPHLTEPQQAQITSAILGVMVTVWLFKQLKRAI